MSRREPDLEIAAAVRAKELRFACRPCVRVTTHADAPASASIESHRTNLPDQVEPGVTYEDVEVRWRASVHVEGPAPR
jgi:hypothetical protein